MWSTPLLPFSWTQGATLMIEGTEHGGSVAPASRRQSCFSSDVIFQWTATRIPDETQQTEPGPSPSPPRSTPRADSGVWGQAGRNNCPRAWSEAPASKVSTAVCRDLAAQPHPPPSSSRVVPANAWPAGRGAESGGPLTILRPGKQRRRP